MHHILVLGAGKIGALISELLVESGSYRVDLADDSFDAAAAAAAASREPKLLQPHRLDAVDVESLRAHLVTHPVKAVISALPFHCNTVVAKECRARGLHYFDLTEDVETTRTIFTIAEGAKTAFVPQCGLAPGFISIAANELISHFDDVHDVRMRVGALPQYPSNALKYALTWSTDGVINEYGNPCYGLVGGMMTQLEPLEGLESIQLDGELYEAFNTSGGLGSLADTHRGRIRNMTYKTMRYPGHCEAMKLLMFGLKLNEDRETLKRILENALPRTLQDVVVIYVSVVGKQGGELREEILLYKVYPQEINGRLWSAIQITTATGLTAVLDLMFSDEKHYQGVVRQEQFSLDSFLNNRFGRYYRHSASSTPWRSTRTNGAEAHGSPALSTGRGAWV